MTQRGGLTLRGNTRNSHNAPTRRMLVEGGSRKRKQGMATLRHIHQMMNERRMVQLADGRVGKVIRVDTLFPSNATTVSVWTADSRYPTVAKVSLGEILGEVEKQSA